MLTPGHTADSISLLLCSNIENNGEDNKLHVDYAFCGDTILIGSLGRTNFSSSSASAMYRSLQLLGNLLTTQTLICSSHDYSNEFTTTISSEMAQYCLLKDVINNGISSEEFISRKAALDSHINDQTGSDIVCGAFIEYANKEIIKEYCSDSLATAMAHSPTLNLLDIREPHEYALQRDARFLNNVPLTRLVNFLGENKLKKQDKIVLVCRSGSRSYVAAQVLARLGFNNVGHLTGGYALNS